MFFKGGGVMSAFSCNSNKVFFLITFVCLGELLDVQRRSFFGFLNFDIYSSLNFVVGVFDWFSVL